MLAAVRLGRKIFREIAPFAVKRFTTSEEYWKRRYHYGGNSGRGSRGESAAYKASFVNNFCREHSIGKVIELGSGDGQNAGLLNVDHYSGFDISQDAVDMARKACHNKPNFSFDLIGSAPYPSADLALSMDVVFHLIEDSSYMEYMKTLGKIGKQYCLIYATDHDEQVSAHVRHRGYSDQFKQINPGWRFRERFDNPLYGAEWRKKPHFCLFERVS